MFSAAETMLIRRSLWPGVGGRAIALVAAIGAIGVMIGVASLILVVSVMNAAEARLGSQIGGIDGHLAITAARHQLLDARRVEALAARTRGVRAAVPSMLAPVMVSLDGRAFGAQAQGVSAREMDRVIDPAMVAIAGTMPHLDGEVAIGADLASKLGAVPGGPLSVSAVAVRPGSQIEVRTLAVRVSGVIESGVATYDATRMVMPIADVGRVLGRHDGVNRVDVRLHDPGRADAVAETLRRRLPGVAVHAWSELNASLVSAMRIEKVAMGTIVSIVTLVALFNIAGSLIMLVRFKRRETAILRTMGMTRASIARVYAAIGVAIGVVGGAAGLAIGLLTIAVKDAAVRAATTYLIRPTVETRVLLDLPLTISAGEIGWIAGLVSLGVLASTAYPALRAAAIDPVTVLRGE